jgi:hypothetical protein
MTGRGRPTTGQRIDIRIPPELLAQIDTDANNADRTRAEQIRHILTNNYDKDPS